MRIRSPFLRWTRDYPPKTARARPSKASGQAYPYGCRRSPPSGRSIAFLPRGCKTKAWRCSSQRRWPQEASGRAVLYTWSVVHQNDLPPFPDRVPYVAAVVDLAEGPRMMTNVVECDPDTLEVGMALRVTYRDLTDEVTIPVFVPA